jgi:ring-1,2-phenylacetyl-CoA epoxidase subunit PaaD
VVSAEVSAVDTLDEVRARVAGVLDPELPMITIADLGILRDVELVDGVARVTITPTYSGCPAMDAIRADIEAALAPRRVVVNTVLAPAWTTDDITLEGRAALAAHGIAPPGPLAGVVALTLTRRCPNCGSARTRELSRFGSTACKALWVCQDCAEPFDLFKEHG